jgi:hypothetical protein
MQNDSASGALLVQAALELSATRERLGDDSQSSGTMRVSGMRPDARVSETQVPRADKIITRLRGLPIQVLPGIGHARAGVIYLPNRTMRHTKRSKPSR